MKNSNFYSFITIFLILVMVNPTNSVAAEIPNGGSPVLVKSVVFSSAYNLQFLASNGTYIFATSTNTGNIVVYRTDLHATAYTFGSVGTGNGQFQNPLGIVCLNNVLYIADGLNNRVQVFSTNGTYLSQFGSYGTGNGQFHTPYGMTTDGTYLYVADFANHRVEVFDLNGSYVRSIGSSGTGISQLQSARDVVVTSSRIYITDDFAGKVNIYDHQGNYINSITTNGLAPNYLESPYFLAIHGNFLYVVDYFMRSIDVYDLDGNYQSVFVGGTGAGSISEMDGMMVYQDIMYMINYLDNTLNELVFLTPPKNLNAFAGDTYISLAWDAPIYSQYIPIQDYKIYRSSDGSNFKLYSQSTTLHFEDYNVVSGTTYSYKVTAVAENSSVGVSGFSNIINAELSTSQNQTITVVSTSYVTASNSSKSKGGFVPLNTSSMIFGIGLLGILSYRRTKSKLK